LASIGYSRWFSQGLYSLLNRVATVFFGFQNIFFMVRMMPKDQIGVWVLFTSVTAILEMIRHGFIRNPFITHLVSAEEADKKTVITTSLVLHCALGLFTSILLLVGAIPLSQFWDAPGLDKLFLLYALNNLVFIPFLHFEYLQTAKSNFKAIFVSNFFRMAVLGAYITIMYFFNRRTTLVELAIVQNIATATGSFVAYLYVKDLAKIFSRVDWKLFRELFHFGKYTFGTNISSMVMKSTDTWMIGRLISPAAVAIYNPALRLSNLVEVPTLTISNIVFPHIHQKMKDHGKQGVRDIYVKSVSLILAAMAPMVIPLYCFAETIITLIFGIEYIESAPILRITIFYSLIIPFNRQFGTVMDGLKNPKLNFYLLLMVAVLNVVFNYIFLSMFGLIGSAYGTLLSYAIVFVLNQIILYRMYDINTFKVFEGIVEWYRLGWEIFRKKIVKTSLM
jgi:lipopolysaccharide exporter